MLELVRRLNDADLAELCPFIVESHIAGYLRPALAHALVEARSAVFSRGPAGSLCFRERDLTPDERTARIASVQVELAGKAILPKAAPEEVDVRPEFKGAPLFRINRNLIFPFGIKGRGVHLVLRYENGDFLIAQRSQAVFTFRGCYDVPVGGVLPAGADPWAHVQVEANEEAGLSPDLIGAPGPAQVLHYARAVKGQDIAGTYKPAFPFETDGGTNRDEVFYWCLPIPDSFKPVPQDGEVRSFLRFTASSLLASLIDSPNSWKTNSAVMLLQCLAQDSALGADPRFDREGLAELLAPDPRT